MLRSESGSTIATQQHVEQITMLLWENRNLRIQLDAAKAKSEKGATKPAMGADSAARL
jgi:hypothetical protein